MMKNILKYKWIILSFITCIFSTLSYAQGPVQIARLQYRGGGDWYSNKTAIPNLIYFCNEHLNTQIEANEVVVKIGSEFIFSYPYIYMTGHGSVMFSKQEAENLRNYLIGGGFLHIDDNYGMDKFIRLEMKKVFPELDFIELPFTHPIYHQPYNFDSGLPKVHEHDGKPSKGLGLIYEGNLICFYSYESDLGNGWEDQNTYNNSEELRLQALKMGGNIINFSFTKL